MSDTVNHPRHYTSTKYEVWDVLDEFFPDDPHKWAAGKYLLRAGKKGDEIEDLQKLIQFAERRISVLEQEREGQSYGYERATQLGFDAADPKDRTYTFGISIDEINWKLLTRYMNPYI